MDKSTVFSKTAKGMTEFRNGGKTLAREHARVLALINGKSSIRDFLNSGALIDGKYDPALEALLAHGLIRVFEKAKVADVIEWNAPGADDDLGDVLPTLAVQELSPQESVQVWAQAKRGATELKTTGFYSYGSKSSLALPTGDGRLKALVVEDDDELAELLVVLLSEKGLAVEVAPNIPAALNAVRGGGQIPSIVLLDIVLPGMPGKDGFDVLSYIRRNEEWAKVPVVMVTSEVSDDQVMKGLKAGADGYMFKPFKWEALYACIQQVAGL